MIVVSSILLSALVKIYAGGCGTPVGEVFVPSDDPAGWQTNVYTAYYTTFSSGDWGGWDEHTPDKTMVIIDFLNDAGGSHVIRGRGNVYWWCVPNTGSGPSFKLWEDMLISDTLVQDCFQVGYLSNFNYSNWQWTTTNNPPQTRYYVYEHIDAWVFE